MDLTNPSLERTNPRTLKMFSLLVKNRATDASNILSAEISTSRTQIFAPGDSRGASTADEDEDGPPFVLQAKDSHIVNAGASTSGMQDFAPMTSPENPSDEEEAYLGSLRRPRRSAGIPLTSGVQVEGKKTILFSRKQRLDRKIKRNSGKEYVTMKGKTVKGRVRKPLEPCRLLCSTKIREEDADNIFTDYWSLGSYNGRAAFVGSALHIEIKSGSRLRENVSPSKRKNRTYTYGYHLDVNGQRVKFCKGCFLKILGEGDNFIKTVAAKKQKKVSGIIEPDGRGHKPNTRAHPSEKIEEVKTHLKSFPAYESHYTRRTNDSLFLQPHLTIDKMYHAYRDEAENPVSLTVYHREFHKMKLKFKKPYVDTCHTCDTYAMKLKVCEDPDEKLKILEERNDHHSAQERAYEEKRIDTEIAKESATNGDESLKCYTLDLQQCLPTPDLKTSVAFYKRQLWTFNLTIHDNATKEVDCFMWHEAISGRGGNQVASCIFKQLKSLPVHVKHVIYYSDTCAGQNRNSHVAAMFTYAMQQLPHLQVVEQKFMVPGHTHLEADQDHSVIERQKKKSNLPIYHPHDWYQLVRSCGPRFHVIEMTGNDFYDFAGLLKTTLVHRKVNEKKEKVKWHGISWLKYTPETFGDILYKTTLLRLAEFDHLSFARRGRSVGDVDLHRLPYPCRISPEKKKDLLSLLPLISNVFHSFYENLPSSDQTEDIDPDLVEFSED